MSKQKILINKDQLSSFLNFPTGVNIQTNEEGLIEITVFLDEEVYNVGELNDSVAINVEDLSKYKKLFTEKQLLEFDEITRMESSRNQMERIESRLRFPKWQQENQMTKEIMDAMADELKKRGKW